MIPHPIYTQSHIYKPASIPLSRTSIMSPHYPHQPTLPSILSLHLPPRHLNPATAANPLPAITPPAIVNNHPFPITSINGCAIANPTHAKTFLPIEFSATPEAGFAGMSSVSMVVTRPKRIMLDMPMKRPVMSCEKYVSDVLCSGRERVILQGRPNEHPFPQSTRTK